MSHVNHDVERPGLRQRLLAKLSLPGRTRSLFSRNRANLSAISVTDSPSPSAWSGPGPEPDFCHVDLNDWYPAYLSCVHFFMSHSQHSPAVQALAAFLNIRLPAQGCADASGAAISVSVSARPYIRRLIVTGLDAPSNLQLFFGDDWAAGVGCICKQERLNYLFAAKSGGWASTKSAYDILPDEQTPFLSPLREPTEEELRVADSLWSEWLAMEDWMVGPRRPW